MKTKNIKPVTITFRPGEGDIKKMLEKLCSKNLRDRSSMMKKLIVDAYNEVKQEEGWK